jgi:hypothetical protein
MGQVRPQAELHPMRVLAAIHLLVPADTELTMPSELGDPISRQLLVALVSRAVWIDRDTGQDPQIPRLRSGQAGAASIVCDMLLLPHTLLTRCDSPMLGCPCRAVLPFRSIHATLLDWPRRRED